MSDKFADDTRRPELTRRSLIGTAAGAVLLPGAARAQAAAPRQGGRFRLGLGGANTGDSHDPATWGTSALVNIGLWGGVYNNLAEIAPDGSLAFELAESVEPSADAKTWTFKLRKGVTFHNGKTVDAQDIVASLNYHRGPNSKSAAKAIISQVTDLRADGDTVVVTLAAGNADFPYLCTDYHLVIGAQQEGKVDWEAANGTGGYRLVNHERGQRMVLKRNPGYWKPGRAHFEDVELIGINDVVARMNALSTGQVDAIGNADVKTLPLLEKNPDLVVDEVTGTQHFTMPMFTDTEPFRDNNVRLALKYAIDRTTIIKTILRGHGQPGNDNPITPANRYYAADIPVREYDPDRAKSLLRQAGQEGLKVTLNAADAAFVGAVDTAILFRAQAAKAGIEVNVVREPNDGYWSNVWTKKPFVMCFWGGRPTEDWMFSQVYSKDAPWNDTHWNNDRFNALLVAARVELDEGKRREMYREMQLLLRDEGGVIVPVYANFVDARNRRIAHAPKIGSNWGLDGWKCVERWWVA